MDSHLKHCKIIIVHQSSHCQQHKRDSDQYVYTASRMEGSSEAATVISRLPNGNYTVEVFDLEPETEHPAFSSVLSIHLSTLDEGL